MWQGMRRPVLCAALALAGLAAVAPGAGAAISPSISLDQSAGTTAGSTANLGVDLKFGQQTGNSDSPDVMALTLPPGLLANASINGGACLAAADLNDSACEVGSGTVAANLDGTIPITTPVTFDLVPPPAPGDLAGLAVNSNGTQIGATADVKVRPSGDPNGVGITIDFVLPNQLYGQSLSITEIKSTFDGLRYPTTCPAAPQTFGVTVNSYGDSSNHTVSAPLSVTGCSGLAYAPKFSVIATRDSADKQATLTTNITQAATESPNRSVALTFPSSVLWANISALHALCPTLSSSCTPVGSATAGSPLYPKPLTGQAYLTGSLSGLSLTLVFPSPFPLTLTGTVNLQTNSTQFSGLPDIPLTSLQVTLNGGADGLFQATCKPASGTATAALSDQNGDKTATVPAGFTVTGCPNSGSTGGGNGGGTSSPGSRPTVGGSILRGLGSGHPTLRFTVSTRGHAPKLTALTIALPRGLGFTRHPRPGITLRGAAIKHWHLAHGRLVITLRHPTSRVIVTLTARALTETRALRAKARRIKKVTLTIVTTTTARRHATLHVGVRPRGL